MAGIAKQIIGSFEDIGEHVVHEVARVPGDMVGKVLEGMGSVSSPKSGAGQKNPGGGGGSDSTQKGALGELGQTGDVEMKKTIARRALQELTGQPKQKEPTLWEQKQQEEEQKKKMQKEQDKKQAQDQLQPVSSKRKRGDLYGVKGKSSTEMSKNVRQD